MKTPSRSERVLEIPGMEAYIAAETEYKAKFGTLSPAGLSMRYANDLNELAAILRKAVATNSPFNASVRGIA